MVLAIPPYEPMAMTTPFTTRDNLSYLQKVNLIREKLNEHIANTSITYLDLVDKLNADFEALGIQWNAELYTVRNEVIEQLGIPGTPAHNAVVAAAGSVYDPATAALVADDGSATGAALSARLAAHTDPLVATLTDTDVTLEARITGVDSDLGDRTSALWRKVAKTLPVIDVRAFGAVGDGVTDDTAAWQAAVDALPVNGTLSGAGRTYLVSSVNLKSDMVLRDASFIAKGGAVDFVSPVTVGAYSDTSLRENITIINVHVDGNRAAQTNISQTEDGGRHGFRFIGAVENVLIQDCSAVNCASDGLTLHRGQGMEGITPYDDGIMHHFRIVNCVFNGNRRHGVALDSCTDIVFEDCKMNGNGLNADGSITPGLDTDGAYGAIMPVANTLYGNGIDMEEYDFKSYTGNIYMKGCELLRNAKSGVLVYSGAMLADSPNFVTRKGFHFERCVIDNGIGGAANILAIDITPLSANKALGWYFDNVSVVDCHLTGYPNFRSVKSARHEGGKVTSSTNYVGNADTVETLVINIPARGTKRYYVAAVTNLFYGNEAESRWVPARDMHILATATMETVNNLPALVMHNQGYDKIGATINLPTDWERAHVDVYWINNSAAAGSPMMNCDTKTIAVGASASLTANGENVFPVAGAQNILSVTRVATNRASLAGGLIALSVLRAGSEAGDTLAGDIAVIGVKITRSF